MFLLDIRMNSLAVCAASAVKCNCLLNRPLLTNFYLSLQVIRVVTVTLGSTAHSTYFTLTSTRLLKGNFTAAQKKITLTLSA